MMKIASIEGRIHPTPIGASITKPHWHNTPSAKIGALDQPKICLRQVSVKLFPTYYVHKAANHSNTTCIKLVPASSKAQVVIPAKIRKKLGRPKTLLVREENGKIILEPALSFKDAFGTGGREAAEIAVEISRDRRKEVESKRKKLPT